MDLQTALILLGIAGLAVVLGVTVWRERITQFFSGSRSRLRPRGGSLSESLGSSLVRSRDFILGRSEKFEVEEPVLGRLDEGEQLEFEFDEPRVDDDLDPVESRAPRPKPRIARRRAAPEDEPLPDVENSEGSVRQIDFWVRIIGDEPVERDRILSIYRQQEYLMQHPHSIHGRAVPSGKWCDMEKQPESTSFTDVVMTLQLYDQSGPVDESELTRFNNLVFLLSEDLDRKFSFQGSVEQALEQAQRLERFCQANDVFAIINICGEGDRLFRGPEVLRAVEGSGMRYGDMHVFHGPDSIHGDPLYSLANMVKPGTFELGKIKEFTTPGLTMFMSVPRCPNPGEVFGRMAYVARKIATQLGGVMLDQKKQPLDDVAIKHIRKQVEEMGVAMSNKGIAPGSEEALRLF